MSPRVVTLDLRDTPPVTGGFFDRIPPGRYRFAVSQVEETQAKSGKKMWKGSYKVVDGPQIGAMVGDNFVLEDNDGKPSKVGLGRLHHFLLCCDLPVAQKSFKLDLDNLNGRQFSADVIDEDYTRNDGSTSTSSKIQRYLLPNQNGNGSSAPTAAVPTEVGEPVAESAEEPPFDTTEVTPEVAAAAAEAEDLFA